jgi:S1-C subfamily serine protease
MKLGDSDALNKGAPVMAVGYPLGMQSLKSSTGVVSGYQQFSKALYMSITAPINPGNSGGPLYNKQGQVVGINSAKLTSAARIAFAIPSKQLKVALDGLYLQREFIEPEVGIVTSVGTEDLNQYLTGLKSTGGVYVKQVTPDGLFAAAGGAEGDLLLAIDGHKVDRFGKIYMDLIKDRVNTQGLLLRHEIGSDIKFDVYRAATEGQGSLLSLTTEYKFTKRPNVHFLYEPIVERPKFVTFAGFVFMKLNLNLVEEHLSNNPKELVKYMEPINRGDDRIIISSLEPASLAYKDGSADDVAGLLVQKINGMTVRTMDDLCAAIAARTLPEEFWTLETQKSFTSLKVQDVLAYEQSDGVKDDMLHQSAFSGCQSAAASKLRKAFRK